MFFYFNEKGKSICIISAVFFTTVLFVTVFSTLFFVMDTGDEMIREAEWILSAVGRSQSPGMTYRVLMISKTIMFVTHNMALTKNCNRVIVVKDGKIVNSGERDGGHK